MRNFITHSLQPHPQPWLLPSKPGTSIFISVPDSSSLARYSPITLYWKNHNFHPSSATLSQDYLDHEIIWRHSISDIVYMEVSYSPWDSFFLLLTCVLIVQTIWAFCVISQASLLHISEISHSLQLIRIGRIFFRPLTHPWPTFSPNGVSQTLPIYFICFFFSTSFLPALGLQRKKGPFSWSDLSELLILSPQNLNLAIKYPCCLTSLGFPYIPFQYLWNGPYALFNEFTHMKYLTKYAVHMKCYEMLYFIIVSWVVIILIVLQLFLHALCSVLYLSIDK